MHFLAQVWKITKNIHHEKITYTFSKKAFLIVALNYKFSYYGEIVVKSFVGCYVETWMIRKDVLWWKSSSIFSVYVLLLPLLALK